LQEAHRLVRLGTPRSVWPDLTALLSILAMATLPQQQNHLQLLFDTYAERIFLNFGYE
jgi:hypothetical protein